MWQCKSIREESRLQHFITFGSRELVRINSELISAYQYFTWSNSFNQQLDRQGLTHDKCILLSRRLQPSEHYKLDSLNTSLYTRFDLQIVKPK